MEIGFGYPLFIRRLIDRVAISCDRDSTAEQYESLLALAAALLIRAHDIDPSTACRLLTVSEEEFTSLVHNVLQIIKYRSLRDSVGDFGVEKQ